MTVVGRVSFRLLQAMLVAICLLAPCSVAFAHPLIENALDVVIERDRIVVDARISPEQILVAGGATSGEPSKEELVALQLKHASYLRSHLRVTIDGTPAAASLSQPTTTDAMALTSLVPFHMEYPSTTPPKTVELYQTFLNESGNWTVSCVLRIRQSTQSTFDTDLLKPGGTAIFDCDPWPDAVATTAPTTAPVNASMPPATIGTEVHLWPTVRAYVSHGFMHILTGFDHLLFVGALVIASRSIWDLIKVITAFTLAHTLTLTLAVLNVVHVSDRLVEPMIAASIVFVALQNLFNPEQSHGRLRLAIAFGFGLFHGLGFAGGLKDAMSEMPSAALWTALLSFSIGVELGHQVVVIPVYTFFRWMRQRPAGTAWSMVDSRARLACSAAIALGGSYFFLVAIKAL